MIGAASWSATIAMLGYVLGQGLERLLGDLRHAEKSVSGAVLFAAAGLWIARRVRAARVS